MKIRSRIIVFFMISSFIPFFILSGTSWYHYQATIRDNAFSYTRQMMTQTATGLEEFLNQLDQFYYAVYAQDLPRLLAELDATSTGSVRAHITLNETIIRLWTFYGLSERMPYLSIVSDSGNIIYQNNRAASSDYQFSQSEWFCALVNSGAHSGLSPAGLLPYQKDDGRTYITYAQKIIDYNTAENNYYFLMDFDTDVVDQLLSTLVTGNTGSLFLLNGNDLIYTINPEPFVMEDIIRFQRECRVQDLSYEETIDGVPYFISSYPVSQASLNILCVNSIPDLTAGVPDLKHFTLLLSGISMLLTVLLSCFFSARLVKPIHDLKEVTYEVMRGNLEVTVPPLTHDEIGDLGTCLDQMLSHIRQLIREKYEYSLREKELQIHTLQSQINPHFLYNTLETISSIAESEGIDPIRDIAFSMAELYRYSISASDRFVPIRCELEYVRHYLDIIRIRFGERIRIHYQIDGDVLESPILKLTLQPIVENAVYHGLEPKRDIGNLTISMHRKESFVEIIIQDDGVGMDKNTLDALQRRLKDPDSDPTAYSGSHIGISNVNRRLRLRFGASSGLQITGTPGGGTCVTIRLAGQSSGFGGSQLEDAGLTPFEQNGFAADGAARK